MTLQTDLFDFAYVPEWYRHLYDLKCMALPEAWQFKKPAVETKNFETPILERYIHTIFRKQAIEFNSESVEEKASKYFHVENECACFHTGLYTPRYKGIYGFFGRNKKMDSMLEWYFRGFCDELSPWLKYIEPLPERPIYPMAQQGLNFNPEWPIRVNVEHILGDEENLDRLPAKIRKAKNYLCCWKQRYSLQDEKLWWSRDLFRHRGIWDGCNTFFRYILQKWTSPTLR